MALTIEQLRAMAGQGAPQGEAPAQAPVPVATEQAPQETTTSTTTTPVSEAPAPDADGDGNPDTHTSLLGSIANAAQERIVEPGRRLATGQSEGVLGAIGDAATVGQNVAGMAMLPFAPAAGAGLLAAPAVGTLLKGGSDYAGLPSSVGNFIAGAGEVLTGGTQMIASSLRNLGKAAGTGAKLMSEVGEGSRLARLAKGSGELSSQNVGRQIQGLVRATLGRRRVPIAAEIDGLEKGLKSVVVNAGDPGYDKAGELVKLARERYIGLSNPNKNVAGHAIERIEKAITDGKPIAADDVVEVRQLLGRKGGASNVLDPNVSPDAAGAAAVRDLATDTIMDILPPRDQQRYGTALVAYKQRFAEPRAALHAITKKSTNPAEAFNIVFNKNNPTVFQEAMKLAQKNPLLKNKLRLGYLENLQRATNGLQDMPAAAKMLDETRQVPELAGLFTPAELNSLKMVFTAPNGGRDILKAFGQGLTVGRTGNAGLIAHFIGQDPVTGMLIAAAAPGGMAALRTMLMAPPGSTANRAAAGALIRGVTAMTQGLSSAHDDETPLEGEDF